ncbi:hypothetical protein, unknown function [Leishmania infantum JPCM5]|uniref:Uncharacterized protein n=2 Tax=Leishmania infantum TaxID=5671 RepID=E9AGB6_LEIIN|nr:hypothetical protein, unknown function [Leishmania infantum JPCM5]CAC9462710.1 hypothetical_protein_-_conserved [Leishmania infantum]CBZ08416.1 hypothetical protein, unknown function [Leishmania infantum JPCM5]SUZ39952.1 hypothetical_protein_-_conserved [Leishmania infantum]|eukprot:XP_003392268.1 hypothetical protein, unknown function [Leishmania infantum JPCM5]
MNDTEDDEKPKAQESVVDDADTDMARTAAEVTAAEALDSRRGAEAVTAGAGGHATLWADRVETVTAYQLASAALRRLPTRTAPVDKDVWRRQRTEEGTTSRVAASATHADVSASPPQPSAAPRGIIFDDADQPAACTTGPSLQTPSAEQVRVAVFTAVSPSSSRFQVPPLQAAHMHAVQPSPHTSSHKGEESAVLTSSEGQSSSSANVYRHTDRQGNGEAAEGANARDDADDEDDVAARVLFSLHRKDDMIRQLTHAVEALQDENALLRSLRAAAPQADAVPPPPATGLALSPDRVKTPSPSWPATPVRWWGTKHKTALSDGLGPRNESSQALEGSGHANVKEQPLRTSPSLSAAHAAVSTIAALQRTLADKEAELEALRSQVVTAGNKNDTRDATAPAEAPPVEYSAGDSVISGARGAPSASPSAAEAAAESRIAQLEWQLQNVQQEKREDTHTLRDHIDHLTRELHRKSRDMERQQRHHKLELAALQQEVTALADQLEEQIRVSASATAAPPRREPEAEQLMELQRELAQAKAREALLLTERAATQQRWLREMEEQKSLLDEARADAAREEQQNECRVQQERQLAQKAAQQQQQLEEQVHQYKEALAQAKRELSDLRAVHQRTEETVSEQRRQLQRISHDIATAALERAHDEQRAARAEEQVRLLHQQLSQAAATVASQEAELESLRQARQDEAAAAVALQEEEHAALLKQVKGCMKGSEAVESALLAAESSRRAMASQLTRALEERNEYHRLLREASVQAQAQLLEQQQLLSEGNDLVHRRLQEAQEHLLQRTETLETTQRELQAAQQRMLALKDELTRSQAAQRQLGEELHAAQARHEAQTAQLVHAKEGLKDALHAQLATMGKLRRKEKQLHSQQAAAQRAMERRQEEQRALQGIVNLLWSPAVFLSPTCPRASGVRPHESSRILRLPPPQVVRSAATLAPEGMPAMSRRALAMLERSATIHTRRSCQIRKRRSVSMAGASAAEVAGVRADAENEDVDETVRPSRSASSVSSAAASVVMSAVSWDNVPAASISDGDTALEERHRTAAAASEEGDVSANSRAAASARVPLHSRLDGGPPALERQLERSAIDHEGEGRTAATEADPSILRLLRAIRDAIEQMCAAYTAAQHELGTKRIAVRTLVKERKAQQVQLEELRATLQEQRHKAERLRRDAVQSVRAASQAELEKVCHAWQEKCEAGMAFQLQTYEEQHRRAVAEVLKACVEHVQAELIVFVELLPTTLSAGLARVAAASAERTRDEVLREVHHQYWCSPSTTSAAHDLVCDNGRGAQARHTSTAAAAADDVSLLSLGLEVQPEVQAECDAIIRDVLHMAGGWADLTSAVLVANSTAAADYPSGSVLPFSALPAPQPCTLTYGAALESRASPPDAEPARRIVVNAEAALWSAEEMAELREVIHAHVTRSLSALTAAASRSSLAGVTTSVSRNGASEERQGVDAHARDAPATVGGASGGTRSTNVKGRVPGEESKTALPRWMREGSASTRPASSPSRCSPVRETESTSTPPRSSAVEDAAAARVPVHHQQPRLLALLLDACVTHVHARLLA